MVGNIITINKVEVLIIIKEGIAVGNRGVVRTIRVGTLGIIDKEAQQITIMEGNIIKLNKATVTAMVGEVIVNIRQTVDYTEVEQQD